MREAITQMVPSPDILLIDALELPSVGLPQRALKRGDSKCLSIAAASILAKVTRDREMISMDVRHPGYGFARHKGYGTSQHRRALEDLGPLGIHRWSFRPIQKAAMRAQVDTQLASEGEHR